MWELDNKEGWCQRIDVFVIMVLEKTLEESLGLQGDQTNQSQRKSVLNILWKSWCWSWSSNTLATWCKELSHWKRPWCWQRLKAVAEDEMVGWHHWLNGHEFEPTPEDSGVQRRMACCSPRDQSWTWCSDWTTTTWIYLQVNRSSLAWRSTTSDVDNKK